MLTANIGWIAFLRSTKTEGSTFSRRRSSGPSIMPMAVCHADPGVPSLGLRPFVHRHVSHQFEALSFHDPEKQKELADRFCDRAEEFFLQRASLLDIPEDALSRRRCFQFLRQPDARVRRRRSGGVGRSNDRFRLCRRRASPTPASFSLPWSGSACLRSRPFL